MNIYITARHFKAHETLRAYAFTAINKLEQFHDGILSADLILSFEKSQKSLKSAELLVKVRGSVIKALQKTEDFPRSIDAVVEKAGRQLQKHKGKVRDQKKIVIRTPRTSD